MDIKEAASLIGSRGGRATASKMTPEQKKERARLGGLSLQKKRREAKAEKEKVV